MTTAASSQRAGAVGFRSERGPILISLMLATSLVALDSTIVATAVPSIVADLGGFSQFPWLFSVYLLAQAVSVPVYGKLSDLFGRKPIMLFGIGLFLLGSILCGFAWSMPALIAFRAVQGLGAGAVQPMSITIAGDIYTLAERAKAQGYLASVWAMSAVVGPTLGGLFAQYLTWRWIFFVNIPLCALAAWMLIRRFHETVRPRVRRRIDYLGSVTLTAGCTLIILGLLEGGQAWAWNSVTSVLVLASGAVLIAIFIAVQRRAADPVLPLWIFSRRVLLASAVVALLVGAVLLGLTTYVPTFVQVVLGTGPLVAGFALATLTIGWPISAALSGRFYLRLGFRTTALIGSVAGHHRRRPVHLARPGIHGVGGRGLLLRGRTGHGAGGQPNADRRPEQCRLGRAGRGDGEQPVLPVHRQRGGCRGVRRDRQRDPGIRHGRRERRVHCRVRWSGRAGAGDPRRLPGRPAVRPGDVRRRLAAARRPADPPAIRRSVSRSGGA